MKRPRWLRARWLLPAVVLLPLVGWGLLLLVVPTGWARGRIVAALADATGRSVQIGDIRLGPLGRVRVSALRVGAPGSASDPWLEVASASTDIHVFQLLAGCTRTKDLAVNGLNLRVLRRKDGTLELADFLRRPRNGQYAERDAEECRATVNVKLHDSRILVVDEASGTRLDFGGVEGTATWVGPKVTVHELHGTLNGGTFELAAQLDRSGHRPSFEGQLRTQDVAVAEGMHALAYVFPVLAGTAPAVDGRLKANVYLKGEGLSGADLNRTLVGHGAVELDPVQLDGSKLLADVARVVDLQGKNRVGTVKSHFAIKNARVASDDLTIQVGRTPLVLAGSTGFDGSVDYRFKTERLTERLPGKARDFLAELQIDLKDVAVVRVQGTLSDMVVSFDGAPVADQNAGPARPEAARANDRQRLRDIGHRLKDRLLR